MITVNRTADHFGNHVVRGAERDGAEPKEKQIVRVPPAHRRLQDSLHRHDKKHQLPGGVEPWKPEKRAEEIPLRNVDLIAAAIAKHHYCPRNNERVRDEKNNRRVTRELEPLITGAVAHKNSAQT